MEPFDGLELVDALAGRAIHVEHRGPYHLLAGAHDAVIRLRASSRSATANT